LSAKSDKLEAVAEWIFRGKWVVKKNIQQLFDEYMIECEFIQMLRPGTLQSRRQSFSNLKKIVPDLSIETLTSNNIAQFFKVLRTRNRVIGKGTIVSGVTKSTVAKYWSDYNSFFSWLKTKAIISNNPLSEMKRPSPRFENRQYLEKMDVGKIITAILFQSDSDFLKIRNLVIFYILLLCGLRRKELLALEMKDIDFVEKTLTIRFETSKGNRTRLIPLHPDLITYLKQYLKVRKHYTTPFLIVSSKKDAGLTNEGLNRLVATLSKQSKVKFHLHQLRHTFAVNFLKNTNNVAKLQQLLGHVDVSITVQYLRCLPPSEMQGDIATMSIDNFM